MFRDELTVLVNKHSLENGCNTPDFLLAEYLMQCLDVFDRIVNKRDDWYGHLPRRSLQMGGAADLAPHIDVLQAAQGTGFAPPGQAREE